MNVETPTKNKSNKKIIFSIFGCVILALCVISLCIALSAYGFFNTMNSSYNNILPTVSAMCASNNDLSSIYESNFTIGYKRRVSLTELQSFYNSNSDIFNYLCIKDYKNFNIQNFLSGDMTLNYNYNVAPSSETIVFSIHNTSKVLKILFLKEVDVYKVDDIAVTNLLGS